MAHRHPVNPLANPYYQPVGVRRYQIRQKIFSIGDKFTIKDEQGQRVFAVRGKVFSLGRKLVLEDMAGNGLIKIHQELLHLHRTYMILSARDIDSDRELALVKKKFSFFHAKFNVESVYGDYYIKELDIISHSFVITKQGQIVAAVNRQSLTLANTYGVEIVSNEDQAFILALAIVIEQVIDEDRQTLQNFNNNQFLTTYAFRI